ncbi:hypothetical protein CU633_02370 [Bacillus sp. V3-13]|uniref:YwqH-like family protein n=1 Tax=Bacillus sp. V3-13 TaxID=2053728 RepID=UPI000C76A6D6|nr:DUF5082 family protein [Bacillus sp. V3-13]PLR79050.1 hypothetical protein CU633_02370 [Bacillus sp. V3-13]
MGIEQLSSQIYSVHSSLNHLSQNIQQKREQLDRLLACERQLFNLHGELQSLLPSTRRPELHPQNWSGSNAEDFENIRNEAIVNNFHQLVNNQYTNLEQTLDHKISQIRNEISSLESQASNQRSRLSRLESQRKEMLARE